MRYFINKNGEFWFENDEENKFCGKIIEKTNSFYLETDLDKSFINSNAFCKLLFIYFVQIIFRNIKIRSVRFGSNVKIFLRKL